MTEALAHPSMARAAVRAMLPKELVSFVRGCRYRGYLAHTSYVLKLKRYRARHLRANAAAGESSIILPGCGRIQIPPDVRDAFEHFGWRDPEMVEEFSGFMKVTSGRRIFWDVGALFGVFSLGFTLLDKSRRALAFEPNPVSRTKLEECLRLNPAASVQVFDCALGRPGEVVEFERGFHYTAVAGLSARPDEQHLIRQETLSIDELIARDLEAPDVIKIDVEGHEFEVLQGAKKLLLARKPLLSLELHPGLLIRKGSSAVAIAEFLEEAGYSFYDTRQKRVPKSYFDRPNNFRVFAK